MKAKAQNELFAAVMARRAKARAVRVLRAQAGIPRTPPVKDPVAHKAAKADWRRKTRWRKMSATKRLGNLGTDRCPILQDPIFRRSLKRNGTSITLTRNCFRVHSRSR